MTETIDESMIQFNKNIEALRMAHAKYGETTDSLRVALNDGFSDLKNMITALITPNSSPMPTKPPDPPDCKQSVISKASKNKLLPLKYSYDEIDDRMTNGFCIFCEEQDSPDHQLKHKNLRIVMVESEDDELVEDYEPETGFKLEAMETNALVQEISSSFANVMTTTEAIQGEKSSDVSESRSDHLIKALPSPEVFNSDLEQVRKYKLQPYNNLSWVELLMSYGIDSLCVPHISPKDYSNDKQITGLSKIDGVVMNEKRFSDFSLYNRVWKPGEISARVSGYCLERFYSESRDFQPRKMGSKICFQRDTKEFAQVVQIRFHIEGLQSYLLVNLMSKDHHLLIVYACTQRHIISGFNELLAGSKERICEDAYSFIKWIRAERILGKRPHDPGIFRKHNCSGEQPEQFWWSFVQRIFKDKYFKGCEIITHKQIYDFGICKQREKAGYELIQELQKSKFSHVFKLRKIDTFVLCSSVAMETCYDISFYEYNLHNLLLYYHGSEVQEMKIFSRTDGLFVDDVWRLLICLSIQLAKELARVVKMRIQSVSLGVEVDFPTQWNQIFDHIMKNLLMHRSTQLVTVCVDTRITLNVGKRELSSLVNVEAGVTIQSHERCAHDYMAIQLLKHIKERGIFFVSHTPFRGFKFKTNKSVDWLIISSVLWLCTPCWLKVLRNIKLEKNWWFKYKSNMLEEFYSNDKALKLKERVHKIKETKKNYFLGEDLSIICVALELCLRHCEGEEKRESQTLLSVEAILYASCSDTKRTMLLWVILEIISLREREDVARGMIKFSMELFEKHLVTVITNDMFHSPRPPELLFCKEEENLLVFESLQSYEGFIFEGKDVLKMGVLLQGFLSGLINHGLAIRFNNLFYN